MPERRWLLVLYKPREFLVSASDMRGRRTVMDLVADIPERVFPIGRLDYQSEGLLLFTNDGELAYRLAHPRFKVDKLYRVEVAGDVKADVVRALSEGVVLDDGPTLPAEVRVVTRNRGRTVLDIQIREGRKRQIRRMLSLFGHGVHRLVRVRFGPLELGDLTSGTWRTLDAREERALREAAGFLGDAEVAS
jgi:pseudouridine synthase